MRKDRGSEQRRAEGRPFGRALSGQLGGGEAEHAFGGFPAYAGGSCIFLHIWKGPGATTSGCTAMKAADVATIVRWLDAAKEPRLVQWTAGESASLDRL